jgi:MFS family permease
MTIAGTRTPYALLVAPFMATGLGMAITMPATTAVVMEAAPPERAGLASGTLNAARQTGGALGVALLGSLVTNKAAFTTVLHAGVLVAGGTYLAGLIATVLVVGRPTNGRCESRANISDLAGRHQRYVTSHESPCPRTTVKPEEPRCACRYCLQPA